MREVIPTLDSWEADTPRVAIATVVATTGSTPRPAGARLAVAPDGRMVGSVSGGCLEADVVEEALRTLAGQAPPRVLHYGISDEMGWAVGLACGGEVDVFVEVLAWSRGDPQIAALRAAIAEDQAVALCTALEGNDPGTRLVVVGGAVVGGLGSGPAPAELVRAASRRLLTGVAGIDHLESGPVFIQPLVPAPKLVIVGAVDTGSRLAELAKLLGYHVTVIDPRERFCTEERFPAVDRLLVTWPGKALATIALEARDAAVCLTHDPKFDDPTLPALFASQVGYIGAIGSRTTQQRRRDRLAEAGATPEDLGRIHGPVGLDLGAATPVEVALEILAEMLAVRYSRSGRPRQAGAPSR